MKCRRCGGTGKEPKWGRLGTVVRERREELGLTTREVARRAGCSATYVSLLESGERGGTNMGVKARRIFRTLRLTPERLR
jgi:transcriptional regulator with XRE-family HTH domain